MTDNHNGEIVHRKLDTDRDNAAIAVAEAVADLEGNEADEVPTTYNCINEMLDEMYADPPSPDAQIEVSFTYAGYRITVEQNGDARFVSVE